MNSFLHLLPSPEEIVEYPTIYFNEALGTLRKSKVEESDLDEGYNFETLVFVLYVPYRKIEAVSLYPRGYYDR